ncbi:Smr/MutS family protein [Capnocytophaga leadbetteri]|uniref:Smr/MutS family protein n=1 Tax=Capnocytophaga leadbetteri TaxID=327575 RepID=UPI003C76FEF0
MKTISKSVNIGDYIEVLDDTIKGHIVRVTPQEVTMLSTEGFELSFRPDEVVVISEEVPIKSAFATIDEESLRKDVLPKRRQKAPLTKREKSIPPMEVDLHIEQLVDSTRNMTNYDMLTLQLETARRQLEFAIAQRIQRVVFIHGVGEGVLRTELEFLLGRYSNVTFYDAEYAKYGVGATEVYIYQKAK